MSSRTLSQSDNQALFSLAHVWQWENVRIMNGFSINSRNRVRLWMKSRGLTRIFFRSTFKFIRFASVIFLRAKKRKNRFALASRSDFFFARTKNRFASNYGRRIRLSDENNANNRPMTSSDINNLLYCIIELEKRSKSVSRKRLVKLQRRQYTVKVIYFPTYSTWFEH